MEDLHTARIGRCAEGQFMIIETLPIPDPQDPTPNAATIYIVQYLFELTGKLRSITPIRLPVGTPHHAREAEKDRLLAKLHAVTFCDITVQPSHHTIDGLPFGLVYDEATDSITLEPGALVTFQPPWDGEYYT